MWECIVGVALEKDGENWGRLRVDYVEEGGREVCWRGGQGVRGGVISEGRGC